MIREMLKKILKRYKFLPNKNLIFDKYKLKLVKFKYLGTNVRLQSDFKFYHTSNLEIRDNVFIGSEADIDSMGGVTIDEGTMIGPRFTCISSNHYYDSDDLKAIPYDNRMILKPIIIHKNVWIGACVSILPGVNIGEGAIIGMGTVVNKNVPPFAIVVGNPNKIVRYRNKEVYNKLKEQKKVYNNIYAGKGFEYIR